MTTVIVFAMNQNRVLIGAAGKWLMDDKPSAEKQAIARAQRTTSDDPYYAFADLFATRPANTLMSKITKKEDYFTTRFVDTTRPNPPGFIKGGIESGETPQQTAAREFEEETFTKFPVERFVEVAPNVYKIDITNEEAEPIVPKWQTNFKNGFGELLKLNWMSVSNVHRSKDMLNSESQTALQYLPRSGGRRTRRRMLHKPKTLKKRIR